MWVQGKRTNWERPSWNPRTHDAKKMGQYRRKLKHFWKKLALRTQLTGGLCLGKEKAHMPWQSTTGVEGIFGRLELASEIFVTLETQRVLQGQIMTPSQPCTCFTACSRYSQAIPRHGDSLPPWVREKVLNCLVHQFLHGQRACVSYLPSALLLGKLVFLFLFLVVTTFGKEESCRI